MYGHLDNWGSDVDAILTASEYEHITAAKCGTGTSKHVESHSTALFTVIKDCLPIATLTWTLPDGSQGAMPFGNAASPNGEVVMSGSPIDHGSEVLCTYKVN